MQICAVESLCEERKSLKLSISNEAFIRFIVPGRHFREMRKLPCMFYSSRTEDTINIFMPNVDCFGRIR